jgi:hypothetical protein
MGSFFTPRKVSTMFNQPLPAIAPVAPTDDAAQEAIVAAAEKRRKAAALAKGAASTILTNGTGIEDNPTIAKKLLFGD